MIFTIINNSVDNTRQSLALFNKDWDTYKKNWQDADGFWNKIGSVFSSNAITASDVEAIKAYNAQIESNVTSQTAFNRSMLDASPAAQNLVASYNGGKVSAEGMAVAQNAAKASTIGLTIAQYALNAAIGMGIGLVVSLVVNGVNKLIHANEEAIKSAKELREEYEEFKTTNAGNVKTLKELKEEFEELSEGVSQYGDNISLTTEQYERYNEIIQQIVGISPSLAEGYSTENGYIADKNGLLERAIELQEIEYRNELRKITNLKNLKTSMSGYIAEYKDAFKDGFVAEGNFKGADDFRDSLYNLFNTVNRKNYDSQSMAKDIMESLGVEDVDAEMQKYFMNGYWQDGWFWDDYRDTIAENLDVVTNSLSFEEVELDEDVFNQNLETLESYAESYRDVKDSAEMANEAIQTDLGYIAEYADGYSDLTTEQKKFVSDFLKDFNISDIGSENALGIFTYDDDKMASVKNQIKEFVEELSKDEATKDALADLYAIPTDEQSVEEFVSQSRNALEIIKAYCEKNGIEIPITIINAEEEINALEDQKQRAVNYAIEKFNGYDPTTFFNENSINTKEEIDKWLEIAQSVNSAVDAEKRYLQVFSEPKQPITITETVDAINNELKPALESLKGSYTSIFSEDGFKAGNVDIDDITSIKSALDNLKEEYKLEIDYEEYEDFVKVITDTDAEESDVQEAFNSMASMMVNASSAVKLTEENFDLLQTQLENLGITNAKEVLSDMKNVQEELADVGIDLQNTTLEEAEAFIYSAEASATATHYLQMYYLEKELANNPLNTSADIAALEQTCSALNITGEYWKSLIRLKSLYYAAEHGGLGTELQDEIQQEKANLDALYKDQYKYKVDLEFDGNIGGSGSGGGSGSEYDWKNLLDKEIAVLEKQLDAGLIDFDTYLGKRLDLIEKYYQEGKIKAEDYYDYLEKTYENQLSIYDRVISAVTNKLEKQIEQLEKQKAVIEEGYQVQIDKLNEEIELLEKEYQKKKDLEELEQARYNAEKARNQRTKKLYTGDNFIYTHDDEAVRSAEEELADKELQMNISRLEEQIESLEKEMEEATKLIDEQIEKLQEYIEQWNDVADTYEEAQNEMLASQVLGAQWEAEILALRQDVLEQFKNEYVRIQEEMANAALKAAEAQLEAEKLLAKGGGSGSGSGGAGGNNTGNSSEKYKYNGTVYNSKKDAEDAKDREIKELEKKLESVNSGNTSADEAQKAAIKEQIRQVKERKITKCAKGGVIKKSDNIFSPIAESIGEDTMIAVRDGERVLTPIQNKHFEKLISISDKLVPALLKGNLLNTGLFGNLQNNNMPYVPATANSINISIGDINLHEVNDVNTLSQAIISQLPNKISQAINRR